MSEEAAQFLEPIVKGIVEHPDEVRIEHSVDERGVLLLVTTHPDDVRHVIGKAGQMANGLRLIMKAYGGRRLARISMKITDPRLAEGSGMAL